MNKCNINKISNFHAMSYETGAYLLILLRILSTNDLMKFEKKMPCIFVVAFCEKGYTIIFKFEKYLKKINSICFVFQIHLAC